MAELMTDGAKAINSRIGVQLFAAGISVDNHILNYQWSTQCICEETLMRPDGLRVIRIGLTISGIDDIDLFHLSVVIPVVIFEIHFF